MTDRGLRVGLLGFIGLLAAAVYVNALTNPFVYDDQVTVVANDSLRTPGNWRYLLLHDRFRPLANLTFAVDFAAHGLDPRGYHVTNLLLHVVNSILLALLVTRIATDAGSGSPAVNGFASGAMFAVHPMATEAVAYVSGRSELLVTTFSLAFMLCMRALLRPPPTTGSRRIALRLGASTTLLLALASKETAAALPFVLLLYDRVLGGGSEPERKRRLLRIHLPLCGLVVALGVLRVASFLLLESELAPRSLWTNALVQFGVIWRYLGLLVLPVGQSVVHPVALVTRATDWRALSALAGLIALVWFAVRARRRAPLCALGLGWFLLFLAPSSAVPLLELMAEHRAYLASAGFYLVLGWGFERLFARGGQDRALASAGLAVLLVAHGSATIARNRVWSSPVRLWQDAARKAPGVWMTQYALGDAYRTAGDCQRAHERYLEAIRLVPEEPRPYVNLADCLVRARDYVTAERMLRSALDVAPGSVEARNSLAFLAYNQSRPEEARELYHGTLEIDPENVVALRGLAYIAEAIDDDPAEALRLLSEIGRLAPLATDIEPWTSRLRRRAHP